MQTFHKLFSNITQIVWSSMSGEEGGGDVVRRGEGIDFEKDERKKWKGRERERERERERGRKRDIDG